MRNPKTHINDLFTDRARSDANSTTLANTLDKDIETVFNSPEKFIFELLQNADDASLSEQENAVCFWLKGNTLLFSHGGRPFDEQDIDAICDNAQCTDVRKKEDIEKIGYKGIGFKSVFVVANKVTIVSGDYSFRFDQNYSRWQEVNQSNRRCPWQLVPIWTEPHELPSEFRLNRNSVNFFLSLRSGLDLSTPFDLVLKDPKVLLFLRHVHKITINFNGQVKTIHRSMQEAICSIHIDNVLSSRWVMERYLTEVPSTLQEKMQRMGTHECPAKLKRVKETQLTFAARVMNKKLNPLLSSPLYCYLPTTTNSGLPFLVNGDFLLTADRMQLLNNDWNAFLFKAIAFYHLNFLANLAKKEDFYTQILTFFVKNLSYLLPSWASSNYSAGLRIGLSKTAFIPAKDFSPILDSFGLPSPKLLKYEDAIADDLHFFSQFKNIDSKYEANLVASSLQNQATLKNHFNWGNLIQHLEVYIKKLPNVKEQSSLVKFLFQNQNQSQNSTMELSQKAFLPSDKGEFLIPGRLSVLGNCVLSEFPDFLDFTWLNKELLTLLSEVELKWLLSLGVKEISNQELLEKIVAMVRSFAGPSYLRSQKSLNAEMAEMLFNMVHSIYFSPEKTSAIGWKISNMTGMFPLVTCAGVVKVAERCYLPSDLIPEFDLEVMIDEPDLFLSPAYHNRYDKGNLRKLLRKLGIRDTVQLEIQNCFENHSPRHRIDHYDDYIKYLREIDKVSFYGGYYRINGFAFLDFMRFLDNPYYAAHFWKKMVERMADVLETFKSVSVLVKSKKYSDTFSATHYISFMLSRTACVQGEDGNYYKANELYNPYLLADLDSSLRDLLKPIASRSQAGILVPKPLFSVCGFKNELIVENYLRLFKLAAEQDLAKNRQRRFHTLCQWLVGASLSAEDKVLLREAHVKLLAANGELRPANTLYYLPKADGVQWLISTQHFCSAYWIKDFPDLGEAGMLQLSKIFDLQQLTVETSEVVYQPSENSVLVENYAQQFKQLLKYAVQNFFYRVPKGKREFDLRQYYRNFFTKFQSLTLVDAKSLALRWEDKPPLVLEVLLLKETLYLQCENHRSFEYFIRMVGDFLGFDDAVIENLFSLSRDTEEVRQERIHEKGWDIEEILAIHEEFEESIVSIPVPLTQPLPAQKVQFGLRENSLLDDEEEVSEPELVLSAPQVTAASLNYDTISLEKAPSNVKKLTALSTIPVAQSTSKITVPSKKSSAKHQGSMLSSVSTGENVSWSGRWGEEVTFGKLKHHYCSKYKTSTFSETESGFVLRGGNLSSSLEVIWANKKLESGLSYDFKIIKNGKERYIDVKSTYHSAGQNVVRISGAEWELMRQVGNRYRLFYVTHAGSESASIQKIKNPSRQITEGELLPREIQLKL